MKRRVMLSAAAAGGASMALAQQPGASESPYEKWLNEDVVYIINAEERAAFLRLATGEERSRFIEQFWERRSPAPGAGATDRNPAMKEHYRRIAYANQRFASASGKAGWQTDRGRTYIVHGPPDEVESHPKGSAETDYPYEVWVYRRIEGIGERVSITFLDRLRNGEYPAGPGIAH